ncbi:MAG: transcriptional repressor [Ruminococcus sp.]|nr:transcriptional repressor [Ruminococcus sp.]MBQ8124203.1 transcriptional repressor [Ruminococcus sp.]
MKRDSGYNTKQKEMLLDFLMTNRSRHTNVAEIGAFLASEGKPLGTATIYRQLDKLVERGVVRKYSFDGKTGACYQYVEDSDSCREHFHLKCLSCGRLIHLDCQHLMGINQHIAQHHGFHIDPVQTVFYGKCADCAEKEEP